MRFIASQSLYKFSDIVFNYTFQIFDSDIFYFYKQVRIKKKLLFSTFLKQKQFVNSIDSVNKVSIDLLNKGNCVKNFNQN